MRVLVQLAAVSLGVVTIAATTGLAQRPAATPPPSNAAAAADATASIVAAAEAVLKTLDAEGRAKVQFPFDGPQNEVVESADRHLQTRGAVARRPDAATASRRRQAARDRAQPGWLPEGHRTAKFWTRT